MSLQKKLNGKRPIGAYFQSWSSSWSGNAESLDLAKLSDSVNIVFLSFANPNCTYTKGSNTFSGTGLDFSSDFNVVRDAIKILQNKKVVVMLSVGGATYAFNDSFDANNIVNFADDLGVDGIDIDWEPSGGASQSYQFGQIIQKIRNIYPNKLLSSAVFSVGAYGQGAFANSQPASANTGMCISGLQSDGSKLDFLNLMSYDASNAYNPIDAFKAYKTYFNGPILIGTEVPPEAWGGHVLTLDEVKTFANYVKSNGNCDGLFVWSYQKTGSPQSQDILSTAKNIFQPSPSPTPTPVPAQKPSPTPVPVQKPSPSPTPVPVQKPSPSPSPTPVPVQSQNWKPNTKYNTGDIVLYNNFTYRCVQGHTSIYTWEPSIYTAALWAKI